MIDKIAELLFEARRHISIARITYGERRIKELDTVANLLNQIEALFNSPR